MLIVWKARPTLALWQALLVGGLTGFGCAIGVHFPMDYLSVSHLAPAWTGAAIYGVGIVCLFPVSREVAMPVGVGSTEVTQTMAEGD
jgi:hypothetical protein